MLVWVEILGSLLSATSLWLLAGFVWKNALAREGIRLFCGFCIFFGLFSLLSVIQDGLPIYLLPYIHNNAELLFWERIGNGVSYFSMPTGVSSAACLFGFIQNFPDKKQLWPEWVSRIIWIGLFFFLTLAVFTVWPIGPYEAFYVVPPFFGWYSGFLVLMFIMIWVNFSWKVYRLREQRPGLIVIGIGLAVFMTGVMICNVIIPAFNIFTWCWVGRILSAVFAFSVFISVTSYKTFRIRTAVHYTVYWACSISVVALLLVGMVYMMYHGFLAGKSPSLAMWILLSAGVAGVIRLYLGVVQPYLDHLFFRRKKELKEQVVYFQKTLSTLTTLPSFMSTANHFLIDSLAVRDVAFLILSKDRALVFVDGKETALAIGFTTAQCSEIEIPTLLEQLAHETQRHFETGHLLQSQGECVGLLCLGEKKNLKPLDTEDERFLGHVLPNLSVYLKNATLYDALQSKRDEVSQLQQHLVALQTDIAAELEEQVLTTGVLHEVKNTHLAMGGLVNQILEKEIKDPEVIDEILRSIGLQSEYLYLFSKNLLYTHQMDNTRHFDPAQRQRNHVLSGIRNTMKHHALLIRSSELSVTMAIPNHATLLVMGNSFQLLLSNLLHNAAKHGGKSLHIAYTQTETDAALTWTSSEFKRVLEGDVKMGVGLTICRQIMTFHGGRLETHLSEDRFVLQLLFV